MVFALPRDFLAASAAHPGAGTEPEATAPPQ
jgi:hypothetical protein